MMMLLKKKVTKRTYCHAVYASDEIRDVGFVERLMKINPAQFRKCENVLPAAT